MIRKRTVRCPGRGADIADARSLITRLKHDLQAGVKNIFAKGRFGHQVNNTYERIAGQIVISISQCRQNFGALTREPEHLCGRPQKTKTMV